MFKAHLHFHGGTTDGKPAFFDRDPLPGQLRSNVCVKRSSQLTRSLHERRAIQLLDMRTRDDLSVDTNGFEIKHSTLSVDSIRSMLAQGQLDEALDEAVNLVKTMTGASHAFAWNHKYRSGATVAPNGVQYRDYHDKPALRLHSDYPLLGGREQADCVLRENGCDLKSGSRIQMFNIWRLLVVDPDSSLAIVDASTLNQADQCIIYKRNGPPDSQPELGIRYNPTQRWHRLSKQRPHELLVFKQYDSDDAVAQVVPHGAFTTGDHNMRESLEIRVVTRFE